MIVPKGLTDASQPRKSFGAGICSIGDPARRGLSDFAAKRLYITAPGLYPWVMRSPKSALKMAAEARR